MSIVLHPTYFPTIASAAVLVQHPVVWEMFDNYQKQTYRNRCYICNDLGKHILSISIQHVGGTQGKQAYRDVKIDNSFPWQRQHWRTLETAYRTSPFFEFYEDDLAPLYQRAFSHLMEFNLATIAFVCECLGINTPTDKTSSYETDLSENSDGRSLANVKNAPLFEQEPYVQVFGDRHGFVKNTSVLDLLFNEGPNAHSYLKGFNTDFLNG